jgi:hypothetical protein
LGSGREQERKEEEEEEREEGIFSSVFPRLTLKDFLSTQPHIES